MRTPSRLSLLIPVTFCLLALSACISSGGPSSSVAPDGLQVIPSSTSVSLNQTMSFQATGGAPPYTYQVNGVGTIDGSGNYQAGPSPGQAEIQVTDANAESAYAMVSVVQMASSSSPYGSPSGGGCASSIYYGSCSGSPYGTSPYGSSPYGSSPYGSSYGSSYGGSTYSSPYVSSPTSAYNPTASSAYYSQSAFSAREMSLVGRPGWSPTTSSQLTQDPPARGQVVAVEDRPLGTGGDAVHMKYLETGLRHPLVRLEELVQKDHQVVAARAIVEDQFLVALRPGLSESDLQAVASQSGAHISKAIQSGSAATYLVTLDENGGTPEIPLSAGFLSRRSQLKQALQAVGEVSPNFVARAPASSPSSH